MDKTPVNDRLAMTGNVQGFELPMGCLMTSAFILLPILTMATGLIWFNGPSDMIYAVLLSAGPIAAVAIAGRIPTLGHSPRSRRP